MAIKKDEIEEEFKEAPEEMENEEKEIRLKEEKIEGEPKKVEIPSELRLSIEKFPELKNIKVDELYTAEVSLRVKEVNEDQVVFEIKNFRLGNKKKTSEEIEKDSEGSYKIRE